MDLGPIQGDELRFLHQAFITDTIGHALQTPNCDVRLYYIDQPDRRRLVEIVTTYISGKLTGKEATAFKKDFKSYKLAKARWGLRIEEVFEDCFKSGYEQALVVGSRTPTVQASKMKSALIMLSEGDAVFGPTPDGRYYAIGMSKGSRIDLAKFDWKSPTIYSDVAATFTDQGLAWSELEIWYCVESSVELELMVRDINQYRFEGDDTSARETEIVMERILAKLG